MENTSVSINSYEKVGGSKMPKSQKTITQEYIIGQLPLTKRLYGIKKKKKRKRL